MDDSVQEQRGSYIVGAYATSPNLFEWDQETELQYFNELKKLPSIRGLELPFWGDGLHPFDDRWLLENIDPSWENVLTCVPGTMKSLESDPNFGLASKSEKSRKDALTLYKKALLAVRKLNNHLGKEAVLAVHITSSPSNTMNNVTGSVDRFLESLLEIASWDWCGAKIVMEHCDAYSERFKPQKGFLPLDDEIDSVSRANEKTNTNMGITINWARSVIEKRNVLGAVEHISEVARSGMLSGIMFSGVTDIKDHKYGQWEDTHMPPARAFDVEYYEDGSLMTVENIEASLMACDMKTLDYIGIKLQAIPKDALIVRRIGINRDAMKILDIVTSRVHDANV